MRAIAILTLTFLPATFVSVRRSKYLVFDPRVSDNNADSLQYDVLQFFAWERSSPRCLGGFREDLDILGHLTSVDHSDNFVLAHMAEKTRNSLISF